METKICNKCGELLSIDSFGIDKSKKNNINIYCKECNKQRYLINKEKISEQRKKHFTENKEEMTEHKKQYNKNNIEQVKLGIKRYAEKNKVEIAERKRKYYKDNLEIFTTQHRIWNLNNKDKSRIIGNSRRSRKKNLPSTLTVEQWSAIKQYFNNKCCYCGKEKPLEQEHFKPLIKGGEFTVNNIVCACRGCNGSKYNKQFIDWYPTYEFHSKKREKIILKFLGYDNKNQQLKII